MEQLSNHLLGVEETLPDPPKSDQILCWIWPAVQRPAHVAQDPVQDTRQDPSAEEERWGKTRGERRQPLQELLF